MTNLTKLTIPALLLVGALVAGGCSGNAPESAAGPGADLPADDARGGEGDEGDDAEWSSPIGDALGEAAESIDDAEHRSRHLAVEDLTVGCMAAEGFTYHPQPLNTDDDRGRPDPASGEFVATYGFGITTTDGGASDDAVEDPNAVMLAEMTPAEQDAWHVALWGAAPASPPSGDEVASPQDLESGGCKDAAIAEVHGEDPYDREAAAAFDPLLAEISSVHDQIRRDPRVEAAAEAYAVCMADAGHPGYSVDGADGAPTPTEAVLDRLHEAAVASAGSSDPDATGSGETLAGGGELSDIPVDVLTEVRAFEIELAVADRPCRDAYERVRREVAFEHETRWVEANRAELEAYRAAVYGENGR